MTKMQRTGTKDVISGIAWLSAGRRAAMVLSFIATAVLARLLSPADFGVMAAAFIVVELSSAIFQGAFGIGIVQNNKKSIKFKRPSFIKEKFDINVCIQQLEIFYGSLIAGQSDTEIKVSHDV